MDQLERNGVNSARYAALELIEADLRDGNRIDAEVARAQLAALRERGELELGLGEVRAYCGPTSDVATVFGVTQDGDVVVPCGDGASILLASESGLWPAVEEPSDPRAMVS